MAKGKDSIGEAEIPLADPENTPIARYSADDGQGHLAEPIQEYDHPDLHSDLAPTDPPDDDDDVAGDDDTVAQADDTTAEPEPAAEGESSTRIDSTKANPHSDGLSDEDRYYRDLGRRAHAAQMAALERQNPRGQNQAQEQDADEEEVDPELEKIAQRTAKIVQRGLRPLIENTNEIAGAYRSSKRNAEISEGRQVAKNTLDRVLKGHAFTRGDASAAELVREEVQEQIDNYFNAAAKGENVGQWHPQQIIDLATKKANRLQKTFADRNMRQTTQRTQVAQATRSTAGGATPRTGAAPAPLNERQLRANADAAARKAGLR